MATVPQSPSPEVSALMRLLLTGGAGPIGSQYPAAEAGADLPAKSGS